MRLVRLGVRGFRNLADESLEIPPCGIVLLGPNGHGKTSLLESVAYPVLFRSFRTAVDSELVRFGEAGFRVELEFEREGHMRSVAGVFRATTREKHYEVDGARALRVRDAAGHWLAVVFAPEDVGLASGPAAGRRAYLDRTLALSDPGYLGALARYRGALAQRNAALRQGQPGLAAAFDAPLAEAGAQVVARRLQWLAEVQDRFRAVLEELGEAGAVAELSYRGARELADPAEWPGRLAEVSARDVLRRATSLGPHRDDLVLWLGRRPLREFGSTGQYRSAAIALKLLELETLEARTGTSPALLLDDVFAELDRDRQRRLASRLFAGRSAQVFITSPRQDELPEGLALPVWQVASGRVTGQLVAG